MKHKNKYEQINFKYNLSIYWDILKKHKYLFFLLLVITLFVEGLFIVDKFNKYYDELTEIEHHEVNHRLIALKKLTKKIINLL